jgi:WS/DGAT/MGAT family acyltransferase
MHIGSTLIVEGPPPPHEDVLAEFESKLHMIPRYRQRVRFVPLELGRPVWVDDPHFNLAYHVRRTALPAPGGEAELRNLIGRLMSAPLDRAKPLWEVWVVEGLDDGRWANISKVHHCMIDGVSGAELMAVLLDVERDPAPITPQTWSPDPEPNNVRLLRHALGERMSVPVEGVRAVRAGIRRPRALAAGAIEGVRSIGEQAGVLRQTAPSSLNGEIGPHRRYGWARGRLADVKAISSDLGGTVNDVVLAAVTSGFRELLLSRGEEVAGRTVRSLVPVSVRAASAKGEPENRVSSMWAELPVGIADPIERLHSISEQLTGLKESRQALGGEVLTSLSGFAPPTLLALSTRLSARLPQRSMNTVTTNVPGPQIPLYTAGRRVLEVFPYVPLGNNVRIGVAIFSYDGGLYVGVTGDWDAVPDIDVLCDGIQAGLTELLSIANGTGPRSDKEAEAASPPAAAEQSGVN